MTQGRNYQDSAINPALTLVALLRDGRLGSHCKAAFCTFPMALRGNDSTTRTWGSFVDRQPGGDVFDELVVVARVRVRGRVACEHEQRTLFAVWHRCLPGGVASRPAGVTSAARNR
jgi:hypothetical protein